MEKDFYQNVDLFLDLFKKNNDKKINSKYKYKISSKKASYSVYKSYNKYTIEFPVSTINQNTNYGSINNLLDDFIKDKYFKNFEMLSTFITSATFRLIIILNDELKITSSYYKVCLFSNNQKNIVIRMNPDNSFRIFENDTKFDKEQITIHIIRKLLSLNIDENFILDENGLIILKMMDI